VNVGGGGLREKREETEELGISPEKRAKSLTGGFLCVGHTVKA